MRRATEDGAPDRLTSGQDLCAVLVTYHPDPLLPTRVSRIVAQAGALVIVDNGSDEAALDMLRGLLVNPQITLIANAKNLGIARALNVGIERAHTLGFAWVVLMDQDSTVDEDMARTLIEVCVAFPEPARLAVVGAGFRDAGVAPAGGDAGNTGHAEASHGANWEEVESVITSGSLMSLAVYSAIGAFREEFFIDYVDTDFCFRARSKGYRVIKTRRALMTHAIGAPTRHSVLWTNKWTTNHSPDRRYYIARNDTVMLHEYGGYAFGTWALKSLLRRLRTCKRIWLYENRKSRKTAAVMQGWWDGVRARLGPRARG